MSKLATVSALLALLTAPALAAEGPVKEPETGVSFAPTDGDHVLLGVGVREKWTFDVYAAGFYVHAKKTPWCEMKDARSTYKKLIHARFPRRMKLVFVRDVDEEKLQDNLRDVLEENMSPAEWKKEQPSVEKFLDAWKGGMRDGQTLTFIDTGSMALVKRGAKTVAEVKSPVLLRAMWRSWFGPDPVSDDLKEGGIKRLAVLKGRYCKP